MFSATEMIGPFIIVFSLGSSFIALVNLQTQEESGYDLSQCTEFNITSIVTCPWQIGTALFKFIFDGLTFNVPDAPWWIRVPIATIVAGMLLFFLFEVVL